ncbi:fibronectin type III domain-containing protein [Patescibacteria group bacterium]
MKKMLLVSLLVVGLVAAGQANAATTATSGETENVREQASVSIQKVKDVTIRYRGAKKIKLRWDKVSKVDGYVVRVLRKKNNRLVKKKFVENPRATVKGLKPYKKYIFRVKAKKNKRFGDYSKKRTIRTKHVGDAKVIDLEIGGTSTVNWSVTGSTPNGQKVVWSKNASPTYPPRSGDYAKYVSDGTTTAEITPYAGTGVYYVRVCEYLGNGTCGTYSNYDVRYLIEEEPDVESISLWSAGGSSIKWGVDGNAAKGYKIAWSKNSDPTYPCRDGDKYKYISDKNTTSASLYGFDGSGTYRVRVCEYLGGACGVYSNQISVYLEGENKEY